MTELAYIVPLIVVAYSLFFLYDWLTVTGKGTKGSMAVFCFGCAFTMIAAVLLLATQLDRCPWDAVAFISLSLAIASFILMVKALFFSLPANTYAAPEPARHAYASGMYALCRHPGVLWYCLAFVFLAIMLRTPAAGIGCAALCIGDLAYMFFQETWSFPRTFCDYAAYQRNVPLFFPTYASLRAALAADGPKANGGCA